MDKLVILVFSFYREDPQTMILLEPLRYCKILRTGEGIIVECPNRKQFLQLHAISKYLMRPLTMLGFGDKIVLKFSRDQKRKIFMRKSSQSDLLA